MIQTLRIATFKIINSRDGLPAFESTADADQVIGVTFGLQILQTMARNAYSKYLKKNQLCAPPPPSVCLWNVG